MGGLGPKGVHLNRFDKFLADSYDNKYMTRDDNKKRAPIDFIESIDVDKTVDALLDHLISLLQENLERFLSTRSRKNKEYKEYKELEFFRDNGYWR
jgi:hypothetical protein